MRVAPCGQPFALNQIGTPERAATRGCLYGAMPLLEIQVAQTFQHRPQHTARQLQHFGGVDDLHNAANRIDRARRRAGQLPEETTDCTHIYRREQVRRRTRRLPGAGRGAEQPQHEVNDALHPFARRPAHRAQALQRGRVH